MKVNLVKLEQLWDGDHDREFMHAADAAIPVLIEIVRAAVALLSIADGDETYDFGHEETVARNRLALALAEVSDAKTD